MRKIECDLYDKIIGRYDMNMTYIIKIMSYRDFNHLVKVSQNRKSFDLGKYFYLNFPDLKNYRFWSHRTDSKVKTIFPVRNTYFAILSQNEKCPEKCVHIWTVGPLQKSIE